VNPEQVPTNLTLSLSSGDPFYAYLTDEFDNFQSLSNVTDARIEMYDQLGGIMKVQRISGTNLVIASDHLECDPLTSPEISLLSDGDRLLVDVIIKISGVWHRSDRFYANVLAGVTATP